MFLHSQKAKTDKLLSWAFFCKPVPEKLLKVYSSLLQINSIPSENCDKRFTVIFPSQLKAMPSDPCPTKSPHSSINLYQRILFLPILTTDYSICNLLQSRCETDVASILHLWHKLRKNKTFLINSVSIFSSKSETQMILIYCNCMYTPSYPSHLVSLQTLHFSVFLK